MAFLFLMGIHMPAFFTFCESLNMIQRVAPEEDLSVCKICAYYSNRSHMEYQLVGKPTLLFDFFGICVCQNCFKDEVSAIALKAGNEPSTEEILRVYSTVRIIMKTRPPCPSSVDDWFLPFSSFLKNVLSDMEGWNHMIDLIMMEKL